jgi:hypothetical protein
MNQKSLLIEGLADAVGFIGGALMGFWLGKLLGLNIFDPGYSNASLVAIGLAGLGGGLGVQVARRMLVTHRAKQAKNAEEKN